MKRTAKRRKAKRVRGVKASAAKARPKPVKARTKPVKVKPKPVKANAVKANVAVTNKLNQLYSR